MDLTNIRRRLDEERRSLVRDGEIIEILPQVTRLQNGSQHSVIYSSLTAEDADGVIGREIEHYRQLETAFEWKVFAHDTPADLRERLSRHRLVAGPLEAVMVFDLSDRPRWEMPEARVVRIDRVEQLPDFRRVAEDVFSKNYDFTVAQLADAVAARSREHQGYIAYAGDEPVSVGRLYTHPASHFAGLYGGGTLKDYRGQGFYRAMIAARARDAMELGAKYLLVDALPTSRPILERLGFRHLTDTWPFEWSPG